MISTIKYCISPQILRSLDVLDVIRSSSPQLFKKAPEEDTRDSRLRIRKWRGYLSTYQLFDNLSGSFMAFLNAFSGLSNDSSDLLVKRQKLTEGRIIKALSERVTVVYRVFTNIFYKIKRNDKTQRERVSAIDHRSPFILLEKVLLIQVNYSSEDPVEVFFRRIFRNFTLGLTL
ncbi:hypothetical protein AVEN_210642-1 [Araneus ventricosus]|uniref:Uncharacterized protein n=1 Tax=Araneus ventricosus TaxID=182803 RepID=A0A4Y1ZKM3_ARAVE|nr:hypothetical protein AVEN_210642-1 [Araneus ventricosus]